MTATTVKKVMTERLKRGTSVVVADSFGQADLRGETMIVASKSVVKCNKGGRCAGNWCVGLAVFVTDPDEVNTDKDMGWRSGTTKICLTHLKDEEGELLVPPPILKQGFDLTPLTEDTPGDRRTNEVTWVELAHAVADGDLERVAFMARTLKTENDSLKSKVIAAQDRLIEQLTR
jgi:hypothetical protein